MLVLLLPLQYDLLLHLLLRARHHERALLLLFPTARLLKAYAHTGCTCYP